MEFMKNIASKFLLFKDLIRKKGAVRALLESGNTAFINFFPPGHFYSPIPDIKTIQSNADLIFDTSPKHIEAVDLNEDRQIQLAKSFAGFYSDLPFTDKKEKQLRYYFDNVYYNYGDGIILYSFLRHFHPKRIIEVGSGFSSALMLDTNDIFNGNINFTFIDPYPERLINLLDKNEKNRTKIESNPVQDVDLELFRTLKKNDILFIDSSHVAKIDSDVLHIIFNILPKLNKGVIIHFHDIFWPFEYPKHWVLEGRAWNESYFLRTFLQHNTAFEILFFNSYMAIHHTKIFEETMPGLLKQTSFKDIPNNSSLWLRKI